MFSNNRANYRRRVSDDESIIHGGYMSSFHLYLYFCYISNHLKLRGASIRWVVPCLSLSRDMRVLIFAVAPGSARPAPLKHCHSMWHCDMCPLEINVPCVNKKKYPRYQVNTSSSPNGKTTWLASLTSGSVEFAD